MESIKKNQLKNNAITVAKKYQFEEKHCLHVAKLALSLFDQLSHLHQLTPQERNILEAATILHDIGWIKGQQKHHKLAQELIINSQRLKVSLKVRILIGLIARYHRKSLPQNSHKYFSQLNKISKKNVKILASFLRIADGLDRMHQSSVENILCKNTSKQIILRLIGKNIIEEDINIAREKADLLKIVFKKPVKILRTNRSFLSHQRNCT
ncbi:MAG TPA: HD domain-containing protein [Candidatus Omnitrophota bacterium]|nr:HD domain-containing protein [Candidatus Omnitrophota bacterium]